MPAELRKSLLDLQQPGPDELARAAEATRDLTDLYAEVANELVAAAIPSEPPNLSTHHPQASPAQSVSPRALNNALADKPASIVIGAHGQTVRHRPERGYTLQLIDGARLAEKTGLAVVTDFRSADVAAGGQGAPLVPAFHALAFASATHRRAIINIGGIANVSLLPVSGSGTVGNARPGSGPSGSPPVGDGAMGSDAMSDGVTGFDTGPGNLLLDFWCDRHTGQPYDDGGRWGTGGQVDEALLKRMLEEPYFSLPAPKSTGRDLFTPQWLDQALNELDPRQNGASSAVLPAPKRESKALDATPNLEARRAQDVQATLVELTATLIARACNDFGAAECFVCGGGAFNQHLMDRLAALVPQAVLQTTQALGVPPDAVEALAFAWLARQRLLNQPANLPAVTGAKGPRVLGAVYAAPNESL